MFAKLIKYFIALILVCVVVLWVYNFAMLNTSNVINDVYYRYTLFLTGVIVGILSSLVIYLVLHRLHKITKVQVDSTRFIDGEGSPSPLVHNSYQEHNNLW